MIPEHAQFHLAILGPRDYYCIVAKNHGTDETKTLWLGKEKVVEEAKRLNDQGFTVWISLMTRS
jgi:biotin synthase-like enzyme